MTLVDQGAHNIKEGTECLSNRAYKLQHLHYHPIHMEYRVAANKFKETMGKTQYKDWKNWLESLSQQDLYIANIYITSEPSDFSSAHIPSLYITSNGHPDLMEDNITKVAALAGSFFPPLPMTLQVPPNQVYPTPLCGPRFFSRARIKQVIQSLSPYKALAQKKFQTLS
jgi:hypothetical protein